MWKWFPAESATVNTSPVVVRVHRFLISVYVVVCIGLLGFLTWSLLAPDPYCVVRETKLAWAEQLSDMFTHTGAFFLLSALWMGLFPLLQRTIPGPAMFLMLAYCLSMEVLQAFVPGRECASLDAIANVSGFVLGLSAVRATLAPRQIFELP
jgi:VanZ family protein